WARVITAYSDANNDKIISASEVTVSDTAVYLGEVSPPFQAALQPELTLFDRFRIGGLLDIRRGFKQRNQTENFRCGQGNSRARSDPTMPLDDQARCVAAPL